MVTLLKGPPLRALTNDSCPMNDSEVINFVGSENYITPESEPQPETSQRLNRCGTYGFLIGYSQISFI